MTESSANPSLFVVACPACGGWCAASAAMAGASACCPQCAAAFLVPRPTATLTPAPAVTATAVTPAPAIIAAPVEPAPPATESAEPLPPCEVPDNELAAAAPAAAIDDLQFREPVRTVGRGANAIALRRLTPEEKDARRRRRNIVMLLTGAAILIAIAVVLGPRRRRR